MKVVIIGQVYKVSVRRTDGIDDKVWSGSPHIGMSANNTMEISHCHLLFAIKGCGQVPGQGVRGQADVRVGLLVVKLDGSDSPYIKK